MRKDSWSIGGVGLLGYWSAGVLEYWIAGLLDCWSTGVLEYWSIKWSHQIRYTWQTERIL